jgi:hypothetical protein
MNNFYFYINYYPYFYLFTQNVSLDDLDDE